MVSYYNPLSYSQCANLYPMSNTWYSNNLPYQQGANASATALFGGGGGVGSGATGGVNMMSNGGYGSANNNGGGIGNGSVGSGGGGSPDSDQGQGSPGMYYQHFQHAMFQQGNSPEWDRSGTPPSSAVAVAAAAALNGNHRGMGQNMRAFTGYPTPTGNHHHQYHQQISSKMGNMMMGATDLRTNMDKLGQISAIPSPPISSPGGNCQTTKQGKTRTEDKYRVVYSDYQRLELEKEYNTSRYITIRRKTELSHSLELSERQVKIWFQNRRAKDRKLTKKRDEVISSAGVAVGMHPHHAHHHHALNHQSHQGGYAEDPSMAAAFNAFDIKPKTEPGLHFQHAAAFHHHQMNLNQHMHGMGLHHHASNYSQHALHHHNHMAGGVAGGAVVPQAPTNIPPSIAPSDSPASINS